ncbi:hypothetical protein ACQ4PT_035925 [Festuca glaucescens]
MPPRRRLSSGYCGVRARPSGTFYTEIRTGDERIGLGTFETAHEAARARRSAASANWSVAFSSSSGTSARGSSGRPASPRTHFATRKAAEKAAKKEDHLFRRANKAARCAFIEAQLEGLKTISDNDNRWADQFSSTPVSSTTSDSSDFE